LILGNAALSFWGQNNYISNAWISFTQKHFAKTTDLHHARNPQMDQASGGRIAEGWSTDSFKKLFGQMIVSESRFDIFLSPFVAHKAEMYLCLHNVRCTSPTVNLFNGRIPWIYDPLSTNMITTASKSKTVKSFADSCLLCTTPKYYVWSSFDLLLLESLLAAVPYLFVTQCCHPILGGRGRTISILIRKAP